MREFEANLKADAMTIVNSTNTAIAAQSGSLQVLGTPFMIALMEKATCRAAADLLDDGETSVGTSINVSHTKPSGIGAVITASAELIEADGRKLTFDVIAKDDKGDIIGKGIIERFVVDSNKFMKKVEAK